MKKIFIILIFTIKIGFSQQAPQYTNYTVNIRTINPGYMINEQGIIEIGSLYRSQWSGMSGSPKTTVLFSSIPLKPNLEMGINFFSDKIGHKIQTVSNNYSIDLAYKINLSHKTSLSMGMKFGVSDIRVNNFNSNISNDPVLNQNSNELLPILGAGVFIFNKNYYAGLSTIDFLSQKLESYTSRTIYQNSSPLYFIGGYIFEISDDFKLKPSLITKYTNGAPLSFDISLNVLYKNKFELGISNRNEDAFSIITGLFLSHNLKTNYSYDFGVNNLSNFNSGSHEFTITYRFNVLNLSKKYISPRFY